MDNGAQASTRTPAVEVSESSLQQSSADNMQLGSNTSVLPSKSKNRVAIQGKATPGPLPVEAEPPSSLLELPTEIISYIFEYLSYEQLSIYRAVSTFFFLVSSKRCFPFFFLFLLKVWILVPVFTKLRLFRCYFFRCVRPLTPLRSQN